MTTKAELIAQCKAENPTMVSVINDNPIELTGADYDKACNDWAEMRLMQIKAETESTKVEADKAALLTKLGITAAEAKLLFQ